MTHAIDAFCDKIICGDSLQVLKTLPPDSVHLVITSPPYFGCRVYGNETLGREANPLDYVKHLFEFMVEVKRVLHPNGSLYLNIGDVYFGTKGFSRNTGQFSRKTDKHYKKHDIVGEDGKYLQHKQLLLLPSRIAIMMQEDGWVLRNQIIWEKPNPIPSFSPDRRLPKYEYIFHMVKTADDYYFDKDAAKKHKNQYDIMRCNIEAYKEHQATFPESLVYPLIMTTSRQDDIVLDPFAGSGTVAVVSKNNGRRYIGIELIKENAELANRRIKELDNNLFAENLKLTKNSTNNTNDINDSDADLTLFEE